MWDGDTFITEGFNSYDNRSEPTVWDGDFKDFLRLGRDHRVSSKPTVWDGDEGGGIKAAGNGTVLSPLCGMVTCCQKLLNFCVL